MPAEKFKAYFFGRKIYLASGISSLLPHTSELKLMFSKAEEDHFSFHRVFYCLKYFNERVLPL